MKTILWVIKAMWVTRADIFQLARIYPGTWDDPRFRDGIGHALTRAGKTRNDASLIEAGEHITSGEYQPNTD